MTRRTNLKTTRQHAMYQYIAAQQQVQAEARQIVEAIKARIDQGVACGTFVLVDESFAWSDTGCDR